MLTLEKKLPQTSFRRSFLFSSSANEALLAGCWEPTILDKRPGESDAILNFVIPVIFGCRKSPSTLLVGWGKGLATFDLKKPHEQAVYSKRFTWYKIAIQENKRCTKTTNTKENCHFKWCQLFVCVVPVRPLLSSIADRLILDWENSWHFVTPPLASPRKDF